MATFSIGEKTVKLTANDGGYLVAISTTRNNWRFKSYGMTVDDYRQALEYFSKTVREWLQEYE